MNTLENIVIISAEMSQLNSHINFDRTTELRTKLLSMGLQFFGVKEHTENGCNYSFVVLTKEVEQMLSLAKQFNQHSILASDSKRHTVVHFVGGESKTLGTLKNVEKSVAQSNKSYIIVTEEGKESFYTALN